MAVLFVAVLVIIGGGWFAYSELTADDGPPPLPPGAIPIDAWAPYWTLEHTLPVTDVRFGDLREVSPFWYSVGPELDIVTDEFAPAEETATFIDRVRDASTELVPSIRDELPAGDMATVLADDELRSRHIDELLAFAEDNDVDGLDLDYEQFAFADGRDTWAATRPNWVAFTEELAAELHARDLTLTVSIPPIYDPDATGGDRGFWVYDHGAIAEHVDRIRIMAYDYSTSDAGPIAPVWWVQQSIDGVSAAVPEEFHDKLVLGVPTYGTNWVVRETGDCPASAQGRTNVPARTARQLADRRGGEPVYDDVDHEWSFSYELEVGAGEQACTQERVVRWIDAEGAAERAKLARYAGWGGVSLWAFGYESQGVWDRLVDATQSSLPATPPSTP